MSALRHMQGRPKKYTLSVHTVVEYSRSHTYVWMYSGLVLTTALVGILLSITAVKMSKRLFVNTAVQLEHL
jgi:hypothetical protein